MLPALPPEPLGLGVDLGTSGIRLALINPAGSVVVELDAAYPLAFDQPAGWLAGLRGLCARLTAPQRAAVAAVAIDGTSGTLLLCRSDGALAPGELARALPYHQACPEHAAEAAALLGDEARHTAAASASGSVARALHLLRKAGTWPQAQGWLLRHQADWLMGWLLADWRWGEEGNNVRLGWDLQRQCWQGQLLEQPWHMALPEICPSGHCLGRLAPQACQMLGLPDTAVVVAGSTDASAAVLAADLQPGDGVTVLGTTLVLKQFSDRPLQGPGVSCQKVAGRWLVGGASNAGAGVLRRFFNDDQLQELSRQIDPRRPTGLDLLPLPRPGERFPVDDPALEPRLEPRPVSDALYLQALLEGLTEIEAAGWQRLQALGAPKVQRLISLGGGARNPQWRALRQRRLGMPVLNRPQCTAARGMAKLALSSVGLR